MLLTHLSLQCSFALFIPSRTYQTLRTCSSGLFRPRSELRCCLQRYCHKDSCSLWPAVRCDPYDKKFQILVVPFAQVESSSLLRTHTADRVFSDRFSTWSVASKGWAAFDSTGTTVSFEMYRSYDISKCSFLEGSALSAFSPINRSDPGFNCNKYSRQCEWSHRCISTNRTSTNSLVWL